MQPETISRAGRRREKAAAKTRAKVETKAAPRSRTNPDVRGEGHPGEGESKDSVSMYLPLRVALSAEAIAHFPGDCAVCGRGAGASVRSVAVTPVDIVGLPLDGSASLVFRLCRPCSELPDARNRRGGARQPGRPRAWPGADVVNDYTQSQYLFGAASGRMGTAEGPRPDSNSTPTPPAPSRRGPRGRAGDSRSSGRSGSPPRATARSCASPTISGSRWSARTSR